MRRREREVERGGVRNEERERKRRRERDRGGEREIEEDRETLFTSIDTQCTLHITVFYNHFHTSQYHIHFFKTLDTFTISVDCELNCGYFCIA